ncbi:uncharacterized protein LOC131178473 [Hevea brasiliensis]|uniref:uncharacterized protein LOC131178473 n=1 Tax=Hevea brasiliensis TaxID=3981 RepID=UPI0025E60849|nr:uncharacterized protein LOC131178473 [Hevea brasiliensis]
MAYVVGGENKEKENEKLSALEERLRAIEGLNMYGSIDVSSLRLVLDVVVPPKFKVPNFDKYTGNSDLRIHLATYIVKMSTLTEDNRLLVHFFHESLSRAALRWCIQLDMMQKKEYAQRWREKAVEVYPPITDNELCSLFIETLKAPYFNLMIENMSNSFSDIIQAGERIEANLRLGRLQELTGENSAKKTANFRKKREGDVHSITRQAQPPLPQNNFRPYPPIQGPMIANLRPPAPQTNPRPPRNFDPPLPLSLSEIYRYLLGINQIVPIPLDLVQPPYPRWYDANARCEYHDGVVGHSTDNCGALRGRVQDERSILEVNQLIPHFKEIFTIAVREGYLCPQGFGPRSDQYNSGCLYHGGAADYELHNCDEFRQEVRRMLSLRILRCQWRSRIEDEVNIARFGRDTSTPNPRIVFSTPNTLTAPVQQITIIRTPPQLPVTNTNAVP